MLRLKSIVISSVDSEATALETHQERARSPISNEKLREVRESQCGRLPDSDDLGAETFIRCKLAASYRVSRADANFLWAGLGSQ